MRPYTTYHHVDIDYVDELKHDESGCLNARITTNVDNFLCSQFRFV